MAKKDTPESDKPFYVNPFGFAGPRDLPVSPPFAFPGVTASMFPLRANISQLTDFCDSYLNMDIPDGIVHYIPALPYVYLAVINYGKLSPLLFSAQNTGWVAQDEVLFLIPLEVWKREGGKMVFKEWACVSPFIFVNNTISQTTGREVYGWAKIFGEIIPDKSTWLKDPTAPARVFGLSAPVFPKEYAGKQEENRVLLEIDRAAPTGFSIPPDLGRSALLNLPGAAKAWLGLAGNAFEIMTALPVRGYRNTRSVRTALEMTNVAVKDLLRLIPNPLRRKLVYQTADSQLGYGRGAEVAVDQITLKQFRDPGRPDKACYQSLVSSSMGLDRINRWGLLGDASSLLRDLSGGFSIRIHDYDAYPIIDSLGLEVERVEDTEGVQSSILKPVFPFWTDVDMFYDKGKTVCYRHRGKYSFGPASGWHVGSAPKNPGNTDRVEADELPKTGDENFDWEEFSLKLRKNGIDYNTVRGGSTQAIAGPFNFPDITVQVYPLLATRDKLKAFVDNYLNLPFNNLNPKSTALRFESFGSYVYLMVESVGSVEGVMWSESNNIGWWDDKTVSFCVPVKMYKDGDFHSIALLTPYCFANDNRAVITGREINGRISVQSTIKALPDVWLEESGPVKDRKFLELSTEVFPAMNVGVQSENRVLLQINGDLPEDFYNDPRWRLVGERWRGPLLGDLKRKTKYFQDHEELVDNCKALALELFSHKAPINWLNLKQYRDAENTERACYQALVNVSRSIERVFDIREIEERLFVRITDFPDFPIVKTLGLQVMNVASKERVEQVLQPIRPFWMRVSIKENLGETLAWRVHKGPWNFTDVLDKEPAHGFSRVGRGLLKSIHPQRLQQQSTRWLSDALRREAQAIQEALLALGPRQDKREKLLGLIVEDSMRRRIQAGPFADDGGRTAQEMALRAVQLADESESDAEYALKLRKLFRSISTNDLCEVVEALGKPLAVVEPGFKQNLAGAGQRFSSADARAWLQELDDLQIVIEPILSDEWENWGEPRWKKCGPNPEPEQVRSHRKPDYCIRKDTFQKDGVFGEGEFGDDIGFKWGVLPIFEFVDGQDRRWVYWSTPTVTQANDLHNPQEDLALLGKCIGEISDGLTDSLVKGFGDALHDVSVESNRKILTDALSDIRRTINKTVTSSLKEISPMLSKISESPAADGSAAPVVIRETPEEVQRGAAKEVGSGPKDKPS